MGSTICTIRPGAGPLSAHAHHEVAVLFLSTERRRGEGLGGGGGSSVFPWGCIPVSYSFLKRYERSINPTHKYFSQFDLPQNKYNLEMQLITVLHTVAMSSRLPLTIGIVCVDC